MSHALLPELVYAEGEFKSDRAVLIEDGRITQVGAITALPTTATVEKLPGRALLPGMVNVHSHSFQRAIRGRTQWKPEGEDADFWSWREAMYRAVLTISPDDLYQISLFCFIEMLLAGYTTVGEFHYVQRDPDGHAYADPNELAGVVIRAAQAAGIRVALLNVCYVTGAIGQPLRPEQRRFATPDLDEFLGATEQLRTSNTLQVGVAPHSVRAVPREWLRPIADYARSHQLPLHMHVSEQPAEVEASLAAYGLRPGALLTAEGVLDEQFTAVHASHLVSEEIRAFGRAGVNVCACPTTERDLGDGILVARELLDAGAHICIGSDSQTVIDPWEEIRSVEYHSRLQRLRRVVLDERVAPGRREITDLLLRTGSANGARALGLATGSITAGLAADLVAVDLAHPVLAGWTAESLAAMIALSGPPSMVSDVWVAGVRRVENGQHELMPYAMHDFHTLSRKLF